MSESGGMHMCVCVCVSMHVLLQWCGAYPVSCLGRPAALHTASLSLYTDVWRGTEVRRCMGLAVKLVLISQNYQKLQTGVHNNQLCILIHEVEPSMKCTHSYVCRLYTVLNAVYCVLDIMKI